MLITALAMADIESRTESLGTRLRSFGARLVGHRTTPMEPPSRASLRIVGRESAPGSPAPKVSEAPDPPATPFPWRRHPQLLTRDGATTIDLEERRARTAAVRGLFNASCGDYEAARLAFGEAARMHAIDLAAAPGFWRLSRAGLTAAVLAYEDAGRLRDAAALAAEITHRLRPHALHPLPTRPPRTAASGA